MSSNDYASLFREKYGLVFYGKRRRYWYNLTEKAFDLEYSTPERLEIGGDVIEANTWGELIRLTSEYLLDLSPKGEEELLSFRTEWSKAAIFESKAKINHIEMKNGLYVNINQTALHAAWLISDLLAFFGIKKELCKLLLRKQPKGEPEEVRSWVRNNVIEQLRPYCAKHKLMSDDRIDKVIRNLETINKIQGKGGSAYNDFFLFDDARLFGSCKSKFLKDLGKTSINKVEVAKYYLDILGDFYRDNGYY